MPSTFFGIELGSRGLAANQLALQVVGENTANINTPGYSRQVVNFDETDPYTAPTYNRFQPGQLGTGVAVTGVNRIRDEFVDKRVYSANSDQGALDNLRDIVARVEEAYNEPGDSGIGQQMTDLLNAFSDLSANPESGAIRSTVRNRAETLVATFHSVNTAMNQINPEIVAKINDKVGVVNDLASQVAALNHQIRLSLAAGDQPNDLQDKRGALLDQLSSLVDIQVSDQTDAQTGAPTGEVQINVGGYALVQSDEANKLPTQPVTGNNFYGLQTTDGTTIPLQGGALYGLIKATTLVKGYQQDLDTLANTLVTAVNSIHESGYGLDGVTNHQFFADPPAGGTVTAGSIVVSTEVENSLDAIAAAAPPTPPNAFAPGNGDNARQIAQLTSTTLPTLGNFSLDEYYNAKVALVGADSQSYQTQSDNQDKIVTLLKNQQSSVSGVNLDEELTHMMQYQRSYQAAARILNMMDGVLNTIINGLGAGATASA